MTAALVSGTYGLPILRTNIGQPTERTVTIKGTTWTCRDFSAPGKLLQEDRSGEFKLTPNHHPEPYESTIDCLNHRTCMLCRGRAGTFITKAEAYAYKRRYPITEGHEPGRETICSG